MLDFLGQHAELRMEGLNCLLARYRAVQVEVRVAKGVFGWYRFVLDDADFVVARCLL